MQRWLRKSIKPIIGSFLISILLWFMVTTSKDYTTQIFVPLEISRLARGKTLSKPIPDRAKIEIQGPGQSIIALYFYKAKFSLELPDINKDYKLHLADYINYLDIPSKLGLEVISILEPSVLDLKVDDFANSEKSVRFAGQLSVEPGYVVLDTMYSQDSVKISGPKSLIDKIPYISTQTVDLKNKKYSFKTMINLASPQPDLVYINPGEIEVNFDIQRIIERVVYDVPINIENIPGKYIVEATPPSLSLRVKGGEKLVEKLKVEEIIAEIDFATQYDPERTDYAVSIKTPENISWLESSPKTFKLKIRRK